jgi:hypothetical protein
VFGYLLLCCTGSDLVINRRQLEVTVELSEQTSRTIVFRAQGCVLLCSSHHES